MIDLRPDHLDTVQCILAEHVPECEVRAFGSRAAWTAKDYSDLDLAVVSAGPLHWRILGRLKEAFEESSLPMRVDVLDWHAIPDSFRQVIERGYVVVQEATKQATADEWPVATIDEIAERVAMGPFGSSIKVETFVPEGVPIISGQHLHGFRVDDSPGFNFISHEHAQRLANANVMRGDIVLTHRGTIGQVACIPKDSRFDRYVVSQSQFFIRCDQSRAIPEFVTMYFRSPEGQHRLLANTSQVGVPSIAQPVTYLRTIEIPLPPLPEQRAIAHVLGTLDDKIELNRRMNETLEAMARALFKDWFVDFGPVRAKMAGRWRRGESLPGLPADFYDLFPDRLVDSELGQIPEGWEVKPLGEVLRSTNERVGDQLVAEYACTTDGLVPRAEMFMKRLSRSAAKNKIVRRNQLVFGLSRRVLNFGRMKEDIGCVSPVYRTYSVGEDVLLPELLEAAMRANPDYFYLAVSSSSREGQSVSEKSLFSLEVVVPKKPVQHILHRMIQDFSKQSALVSEDSLLLATQRDALLPKLISGALGVTNGSD